MVAECRGGLSRSRNSKKSQKVQYPGQHRQNSAALRSYPKKSLRVLSHLISPYFTFKNSNHTNFFHPACLRLLITILEILEFFFETLESTVDEVQGEVRRV